MAKKNLLPGLPKVQKAIRNASFSAAEFAGKLSEIGQAASKAGEEWAKEFKALSSEEQKKHLEAEDQLQSRMDKTNYY